MHLKGDNCGLATNSGIQVVTHLGIAFGIALASLSILVLTRSNDIEIARQISILERKQQFHDLTTSIPSKSLLSDQEEVTTESIVENLQELAIVLLTSGTGVLTASLFQILSSILLLCSIHKEIKAICQFWICVTFIVILGLIISIFLLLSINISPYPFSTTEQVFIFLIVGDIMFSLYSIWVVLSLY